MWDFRTGVIPLLVLAALGVWSVWLGRGGSVRAKQMREQLNMPEKDEMERAIHHKSITAAYYAMLCVLGVYMLYIGWVKQEGINNIALAAILAAFAVQTGVTAVLRYRSTKGDEEYKPHPLWKTLLLLAVIVIGGTAACFLLLILVLSV